MQHTIINGVFHFREIDGDRWTRCSKEILEEMLDAYLARNKAKVTKEEFDVPAHEAQTKLKSAVA